MTEQNVIALQEQLIRLGLGDQAGELYMNRNNPQKEFSIVWSAQKDDDLLQYCLRFERESKDAFLLKEYELTMRTIPLPTSYSLLNEELMVADAMTNAYLSGNEEAGDHEFCQATKNKLKELHEADPAAAELFMFKYWPQSIYKEFIPDDSSLKQRYEITLWVEAKGDNTMTAAVAYQYIKQMNREHVIADELLTIAKNEMQNGNHFIAYNQINYFLDKPDMYFFKSKEEANEFSDNNISEYDNFKVIHAESMDELLKQIPYGEQLRIQLLTNKFQTMNEQNLKYLQDNIKYHGFGETLNPELESQLAKGNAEFSLAFKSEVNKKEIEATLHFKKSDTTDMYFFNKYDSKVKNERNEDMAQTFYINKGSGVTLKEAYNLLNGRAVHKELTNKEDQKYKAWIQLDFSTKDKHGNYERKQYHENYGYDLKEALSFYPIKDMMKDEEMKTLVRSLEKGNVQMVTLDTPGKEIKVFIEANPQYKSINLYNGKMERLDQDQRQEMMRQPEMKEEKGQDKSKDQKQSLAGEDKGEKKLGKGKKAGSDDESKGLVTKKRNNHNRGMGVH